MTWGVHVILLQPGGIATPMVRRSRDTLAETVASLSNVDRELYSDFFKQMLLRAEASLQDANFTLPETVAKVAIHAIECEEPSSRYPIGADA
jgi:NAD(P)-dependent dehydrogenase (short-subunit alcohol dehydrogenase family)